MPKPLENEKAALVLTRKNKFFHFQYYFVGWRVCLCVCMHYCVILCVCARVYAHMRVYEIRTPKNNLVFFS